MTHTIKVKIKRTLTEFIRPLVFAKFRWRKRTSRLPLRTAVDKECNETLNVCFPETKKAIERDERVEKNIPRDMRLPEGKKFHRQCYKKYHRKVPNLKMHMLDQNDFSLPRDAIEDDVNFASSAATDLPNKIRASINRHDTLPKLKSSGR